MLDLLKPFVAKTDGNSYDVQRPALALKYVYAGGTGMYASDSYTLVKIDTAGRKVIETPLLYNAKNDDAITDASVKDWPIDLVKDAMPDPDNKAVKCIIINAEYLYKVARLLRKNSLGEGVNDIDIYFTDAMSPLMFKGKVSGTDQAITALIMPIRQ